jgi:hypothetical protein
MNTNPTARPTNPRLARVLRIGGGVLALLMAIGFGVQMQADHHIVALAPVVSAEHA